MVQSTMPERSASRHGLAMLLAAALFAVTTPLHAEPLVRVRTQLGDIVIDLLPDEAPASVNNFLNYVRDNDYERAFIHRSVAGFVIQGGGFQFITTDNGTQVARTRTDPPVVNEPGVLNLRGTVAMAKLPDLPNSATNQWFVNLSDNANLDNQNGGFTVFGRVIGDGMMVADAIAALPVRNASSIASAFSTLPVVDHVEDNPLTVANFVDTALTEVGADMQEFAPLSASLQAAVLPTTRAVQVGSTATGFATIINSDAMAAQNCRIAPITPAGATPTYATFSYDITDPATNAPMGRVNQPVNIAAGASQTFVFSFVPNEAMEPTELDLRFDCANAGRAQRLPGVNTFLLASSSEPVADVVALSTAALVTLPGENGSGALAVAISNVGASGMITASVDTGDGNLPLAASLCRTDMVGNCIDTASTNVTLDLFDNETATFGVFITAGGAIGFDPAAHRLFVRFTDEQGAVRGATSVAIMTEATEDQEQSEEQTE